MAEKVVRDCIIEAFGDYKVDLEAYETPPSLTKKTFVGKSLYISASLQLESTSVFDLFQQVKKVDKNVVTVLLSGDNQLIEESISIDAIDLRLPKGIGVTKMIENLCRDIQKIQLSGIRSN